MAWLNIFCLLVVIVYSVFLLRNVFTLYPRKKKEMIPGEYVPSQKITVIIPARNEEKNLQACLESIAQQEFPRELLEVIVVNDHSEDDTAAVADSFLNENFSNWKLISLQKEEAGKKTAISRAVEQSSGDIIVTRDADTVSTGIDWLRHIAYAMETNPCDLLLLPVLLSGDNSFISSFQKYENLAISFLGLSMAKNKLPIVCSGANLAYKKDAFLKLNPYKGNLHIPSGDDMFLLKAARKARLRIEAANIPVITPVEASLNSAIKQRMRWAGKGTRIITLPVIMSGLTLFLGNLGCLLALGGLLIDTSYLAFGLFTLTIKLIIDFLLLFLSARMFNTKLNPTWFLPAFVFNLAYMPVIAGLSLFAKPAWKGRKI